MKHEKLAIGVLVILLVAGVAGVSASAPDASGVQELAQEVPVWQQVNSNGFGSQQAGEVSAVEAFNGHLYAGTHNATDGARILRSPDGVTWTPVTQPGFGISHDIAPPAILDLTVFGGRLYASTGRGDGPGQIWRTLDGVNWAPMVIHGFSDPDTRDISALVEYGGLIYAGATNLITGAQIWRSYTGDNNTWTQVAPAETGTAPAGVTGFALFDGALYAAAESDAPVQIWRSYGSGWTTVVSDGFGDPDTTSTGGMAAFAGYLYAGAGNAVDGAQLWRTNDGESWEQAISPGFGDPNNQKVEMVFVFQNQLYVGVKNSSTGIELWRTTDGSLWERANQDGFGDGNNAGSNGSNATADFLGQLYVGTSNAVDGGELWRMQQQAETRQADLSISQVRVGGGSVVAGERITYTLSITNAGPTTPVTVTVVDAWTPAAAVVEVDAPGCATDLAGGVITCTRAGLGLGSVLLPDPHLVFTTSQTFSGTLVNVAHVAATGGVSDSNPANNSSAPIAVSVTRSKYALYLPLVIR